MDKITYSAPELAILLGISRSAAYNLMHRADFPSFRIGKRLLVKRDSSGRSHSRKCVPQGSCPSRIGQDAPPSPW